MKRFEFKLQRLLDIRAVREREVQNELAGLVAIQNRERMKQEYYRRSIAEQHGKFSAKLKRGGYSYSEALAFERYVDFSHKVVVAQQQRIEAMEPEIQKVRERLVQVSKERKVVERLKERRKQEYLYEYNREMAKEIDDMNQKKYILHRIEAMRSATI